jgi:hypothetical protein
MSERRAIRAKESAKIKFTKNLATLDDTVNDCDFRPEKSDDKRFLELYQV